MITMEWKRSAFRAGEYRCPAPPVSTSGWRESEWIGWIDLRGEWNLEPYFPTPKPSADRVLEVWLAPDAYGNQAWWAEYSDLDLGPVQTAFLQAMDVDRVLDELRNLNPDYLVRERGEA